MKLRNGSKDLKAFDNLQFLENLIELFTWYKFSTKAGKKYTSFSLPGAKRADMSMLPLL